jgi:hypothetical protein
MLGAFQVYYLEHLDRERRRQHLYEHRGLRKRKDGNG